VELRDYLRILHKNWILIKACTLLGVAAASAVSIMATPKYVSSSELDVSVRSGAESATSELGRATERLVFARVVFARSGVHSAGSGRTPADGTFI
jgi:uncharacterized protein involved in exopolysaccharide biosynthesis